MQSTEQAKAEARGERLEARVGREERRKCRVQKAKGKMGMAVPGGGEEGKRLR
jgi:hypothetical protein